MNLNVASYEDILFYSKEQPKYLKQLYDAFLPGPLTIILKANDQVPRWINSGLATVGFRLPNHPVTRELIQAEGPLIGPSANKSGKESGRHFDDIRAQFDFQVTGYQDDNALLGVNNVLQWMDRISHEGYYVKMAVAWALSVCYVKFPQKTVNYLKENHLDDFTYNKALQKIIESYRVSTEDKEIIRSMKRKNK